MTIMILIGKTLLFQMVQMLAGCLLAYALWKMLEGKPGAVSELNREKVLVTILASLMGIALPMGIYGMIPMVLVLVRLGLRFSLAVPLLVSNFLFNMLVPFTEVGFSWKSGLLRMLLAVGMGIAAGLVLSRIKTDPAGLLRTVGLKENPKGPIGLAHSYLMAAGVYLILGVVLEVIFKEYFFYDFVNVVNISQISAVVFGFVKGYDITTGLFLINMILFNLVVNVITLSGVLFLFKWRGTLVYYAYFCVWVMVFCVINIFI